MRYAVACLSLVSAAALAHCAAPDPGEPSRGDGPAPAVTPVPEPAPAPTPAPTPAPDEPPTPWLETPRDLVVAIDRATGASRVWVNRTTIPESARVFLRLRTGQLPTETAPVLDCAAMAQDTPALAGTPIRERGGDTYAGPLVAQSLLDFSAIFNDPGWRDLAALPALAARVQAGTPIVEACIVGADGATLATYEDVMDRAFDNSARYEGLTSVAPTSRAYLPTDIYNSASDYAKLCVSLLGEIPFFDATDDGFAHLDVDGFHSVVPAGATTTIRPGYATMNLVDHGAEGALIPLTANGEPADCETTSSGYNCRARCDRPEWYAFTGSSDVG